MFEQQLDLCINEGETLLMCLDAAESVSKGQEVVSEAEMRKIHELRSVLERIHRKYNDLYVEIDPPMAVLR